MFIRQLEAKCDEPQPKNSITSSYKSYFCKYLCFGIICQYSICLCWLLGVKLRHPLLSFSHTKRTFGSQRIVWCLFFANRIVDYTSICTLFSFVFLCSLVGFVAIVSKADNYISLSSSIHILSISSQPFHLFFYLYMPLLSILTSITPIVNHSLTSHFSGKYES